MWIGSAVVILLAALPQAAPVSLVIVKPTLHQFEDGPPVYADHRYIPGETVFFSFQAQGYQVARKDDSRKVLLSYRIDALDSGDVRLVETATGKIDTELTPQDKDWLPKVRHSFLIPPHALPGSYKILASIKDELSGQEANTEVSFTVHGRHVEPSETLVVRNFRFQRSENATQSLVTAAYRAGDTLWAKFDITGFQVGEKNRIWVEYGISILNSEGKVLYSQPEGAVEQDAPFYPKRYVPGIVSLNIQPGTPAGEYAILVTARDEVGKHTVESRHVFRVE